MQYARILALIDAEVERLQKARQLLLSSLTTLRTAQKKRPQRLIRPVASEVAKAQVSPPVPQVSLAAPTVVRHKPAKKEPRGERPSVSKPAVAAVSENPLGGMVPTAPVFVSAQHIRETQAQRQPMQPAGQSHFPSSADESVTAEQLSRRWLHSSTS